MRSKFYSIGIIFLVLMVFSTCTKDETLITSEGKSFALKTAPIENVVITVEPSGVDDTQAIRNAFQEAKIAGPGSIVYLTEGLFKITEPIEVTDFSGSLSGAGMELTEISIESLSETMLCFKGLTGGYSITISDLSFQYNEIIIPGASVIRYYEGTDPSKTHIQNTSITGIKGQGVHDKWAIGILFEPTSNIQIDAIIENCLFVNAGEAIKIHRDLNSTFTICNNQFVDLENGIVQFSSIGSNFIIYKNRFDFNVPKQWFYTAGIFLFGGVKGYNSNFLITQNEFEIDHQPGIWVWDMEYEISKVKTMQIEIKSNVFNLSDVYFDGITVYFTEDLLVSNNRFMGNAWSAVWAWSAENLVVLGDNINNLICTEFEVSEGVFDEFPIQFLYETKNCTVIGNAKDNVLDEGIGNILTGVTPYSHSPGSVLSDVMRNRINKILNH